MSEGIKPALTADEWVARFVQVDEENGDMYEIAEDEDGVLFVGQEAWTLGVRVADPEGRHALAAIALSRQPFGFTQEDVDLLRDAIVMEKYECHIDEERTDRLERVADRIEALLPREEGDNDRR